MKTNVRFLGHALHPMMVVMPLGMLAGSVAFDLVFFATRVPIFSRVSFWNLTGGIATALLAALIGLIDLLATPPRTRARRVGVAHLLVMLGAVLMFLISWATRLYLQFLAVTAGQFVLSVIALVLLSIGGWLGGELVERFGVGVYSGAGPDASLSLSRKARPPSAPLHPTEPRPA
jgi:uncharacterized membrane protein